jgi:hypothetical protein
MSDLLKEAIADAKAVRETALQNAKMALEEAFTPHLKSMLSAKLAEDDLDEENPFADDDEEEGEEDAEEMARQYREEDDEDAAVDIDIDADGEEDEEEMEGVSEEEIIEIDGVKYAPIVSEDEEEFGDDEEEVEEDLDLESVIKELESELSEEDETGETAVDEADETEGEEVNEDEEIEVDESLFLEEDDEDEEEVEESVENTDNYDEIKSELNQYKEAVEFMKNKLHEVNILNAKLLFTNKLFREYSLDNGQKLKVVETFDRAQTTREIKLVYSTLAEQFGDNTTITRKTKHITESASSAVGSTKPSKESRKVITEEQQVANRFKKLAGLIK